jgi:hypothetical protein
MMEKEEIMKEIITIQMVVAVAVAVAVARAIIAEEDVEDAQDAEEVAAKEATTIVSI